MKRILILFLVLAVAGGLFAQVNWSGSVYGGLGMTKLDGQDDWAFGTGTGTVFANDNYRLRLNGTYTNEEGTAGGRFRVQNYGSATTWASSLSIPYAWGWLSFADGLVKVTGGRVSEIEFNAVDSWDSGGSFFSSAYGLQAYVYPADIFRFGVGAKAGKGLSEGEKLAEGFTGWLGLATDLDAFSLAAQMEAGKDNVNAFLSLNFEGLSDLGLTLGAYAEASNLTEYSDAGELYAALSVEYSGLLDAWLYVIPYLSQAEEDMFLGLNVGAEYAIGNITPGLDVNFVLQGGAYDGLFDWEETFTKDHSYVGFKPYVAFTPNGTSANVKLGYNLAMDLSKIEPPNGKKGGMNHAAFIDFSWSF